MDKFAVKTNQPETHKRYKTGVTITTFPQNTYDVVQGGKTVCKIPDYVSNPLGVATGLAEILNRERKLILPV